MKKISFNTILFLFGLSFFMVSCKKSNRGQVRHIVVFKYNQDATPDKIKKIKDAFVDLENKIPGIVSLEYGVNDSPENKNMGFTHVFQVTFEDKAARDHYLPHPEHKKFGELLRNQGILEDVFVVDYAP